MSRRDIQDRRIRLVKVLLDLSARSLDERGTARMLADWFGLPVDTVRRTANRLGVELCAHDGLGHLVRKKKRTHKRKSHWGFTGVV